MFFEGLKCLWLSWTSSLMSMAACLDPVKYLTAMKDISNELTESFETQEFVEDLQFNAEVHDNYEFKDIVIIGNGPSGIALSFMLSGNLPYFNGLYNHPDEFLSARLAALPKGRSLTEHDLKLLATGLEGRSKNPISLLIDALEHPCADLGYNLPSLINWETNRTNTKIDHVVLGKGQPGGSWHTMDPYILTLSLGSWMALPGLPYFSKLETRTSAGDVARYYSEFVRRLDLERFFRNNTIVTQVKRITNCKKKMKTPTNSVGVQNIESKQAINGKFQNGQSHENGLDVHSIMKKNSKKPIDLSDKTLRTKKLHSTDLNSNKKIMTSDDTICCFCNEIERQNMKFISCECCQMDESFCKSNKEEYCFNDYNSHLPFTISCPEIKRTNEQRLGSILDRSQSLTCDKNDYWKCSRFCSKMNRTTDNKKSFGCNSENSLLTAKRRPSKESNTSQSSPLSSNTNSESFHEPDSLTNGFDSTCSACESKWQVDGYDIETGKRFTYITNKVVLATGSSDRPNKLGVPGENEHPDWILHHLRNLENGLDSFSESEREVADPVLVIGAGLSAADAVIAARFRSVPVIHVFRRRNTGLDKQLPENMYPEYHKIHQMMINPNNEYPLYTALPEHILVEISASNRKVTLKNAKTGTLREIKVSFIAILIGSRPDLNFFSSDVSLGVDKSLPIDCKTNPVEINPYTHEVVNLPGAYALGPLAGDNFVRFIPGGAVAIISDLLKSRLPSPTDGTQPANGRTIDDEECIENDV